MSELLFGLICIIFILVVIGTLISLIYVTGNMVSDCLIDVLDYFGRGDGNG